MRRSESGRPAGLADLPGVLGRVVLSTLLPARRPSYGARKVKCATPATSAVTTVAPRGHRLARTC